MKNVCERYICSCIFWILYGVVAIGALGTPETAPGADHGTSTGAEGQHLKGICQGGPGVIFICGPRNAEDLAVIPQSQWIITSGLAGANGLGGAIYLIDRRDDSWMELYGAESADRNNSVGEAFPYSDCRSPVAQSRLSAHGIHLRKEAGNRWVTYCRGMEASAGKRGVISQWHRGVTRRSVAVRN